ncbi:MAG: hypothetical protein R3B70_34370 [Polyangiaceae bacterium]
MNHYTDSAGYNAITSQPEWLLSLRSRLAITRKGPIRDSLSAQSWEEHGAIPENEDSMIHIILSDEETTIVVDNPDGPVAAMAREIFDGLRIKRLMPRTTSKPRQVSDELRV